MTAPTKRPVFVSSVQKELAHERAAVAQLIEPKGKGRGARYILKGNR